MFARKTFKIRQIHHHNVIKKKGGGGGAGADVALRRREMRHLCARKPAPVLSLGGLGSRVQIC